MSEIAEKSGATNFKSRRLIEMYNCESVLKAARMLPTEKDPLTKREYSTPMCKFDKNILEALRDQMSDQRQLILCPGGTNASGWKELTTDQYRNL